MAKKKQKDESKRKELTWQDVHKDEAERILERRRIAFGIPKPPGVHTLNEVDTSDKGDSGVGSVRRSPSDSNKEPLCDIVGLALSGGGIRSAVFNDGFLQALSHCGMLRYVDYISSVSGGGYTAGHLVATAKQYEVRNHGKTKNLHEDNDLNKLGKDPESGEIDPDRLDGIGHYLSRKNVFLAKYFFCQLFTVALYLGIVGIFASAVALFWRSFDNSEFRVACDLLGFRYGDEFFIAFLPTICVGLVWFLSGCLIVARRLLRFGAPRQTNEELVVKICRVMFWLMLGCSLISLAVFLGNGKTKASASGDGYFVLNRFAQVLAIIVAIFQIMVFFGREKLFASEKSHAKIWQRTAHSLMSSGVVLLGLFVVVHWMCRENLSGFLQYRDVDVGRAEVLDWPQMLALATKDQQRLINEVRERTDDLEQTRRELVDPESKWSKHRDLGFFLPDVETSPSYSIKIETATSQKAPGTSAGKAKGNQNEKQNEVSQLCKCNLFVRAGYLGRAYLETITNRFVDEANVSLASPQGYQRVQIMAAKTAELWRGREAFLADFNKNVLPSEKLTKALIADKKANVSWNATQKSQFEKIAGVSLADDEIGATQKILSATQIAETNRTLLELRFPNLLNPRSIASTPVIVKHDQRARWEWHFYWWALAIIGFIATYQVNIHVPFYRFYRQMLSENFLKGWIPSAYRDKTTKLSPGELALWECDPTTVGMPYPILLGCLMQPFKTQGRPQIKKSPFLFTPKYVGVSDCEGMIVSTEEMYNPGVSKSIQLADAVAMSGSAVTPFMSSSPALMLLLSFFGIRLGQYLPNPRFVHQGKRNRLLGYIGLAKIVGSGLLFKPIADDWKFGFVADGGFVDFLGVDELLRRRCSLIIVSDAGCNSKGKELESLAKMLSDAEERLGVKFYDLDHEAPIDFERLGRDEKAEVPQPYLCVRIRYPDVSVDASKNSAESDERELNGILIYAQMAITDSDPLEIRQIRNRFTSFPDEPTTNQFYTQEQVSAYRRLGYHVGKRICHEIQRWSQEEIMAAARKLAPVGGPYFGWSEGVAPQATKGFDEAGFDRVTGYGRRQPLLSVIRDRIMVSYRMVCYHERAYHPDDIFSEAIWNQKGGCYVTFTKATKRLKLGSNKSDTDFAELWLTIYERNADVRAAYRQAVFFDINRSVLVDSKKRTSVNETFELLESEVLGKNPSPELKARLQMAHMSVVAVACHQLHRGIPGFIFQIGGRRKLLDLVRSIVEGLSPNDCAIGLEGLVEQVNKAYPDLIEMQHCVFQDAEQLTIVSFAQCLAMHIHRFICGGDQQPFNAVVFRKRLYDAFKTNEIGGIERAVEEAITELASD